MKRHKLTAATAVTAALLSASGCGIQSTSINTFAVAVAAPTSTPSSGETTTTPGKYRFWVYLLQPGNQLIPIQRTSDTPPTMQSVVTSLVRQPAEQGYSNELTLYPDLTISAVPDVGQLYSLSIPFNAFTAPAGWQLLCTVWQFAQTTHPVNAAYGSAVSFNVKGPNTGWHDCTEYTSNTPPGTKVPASTSTSLTKAGAGYPSSTAAGPGFIADSPTSTPGR